MSEDDAQRVGLDCYYFEDSYIERIITSEHELKIWILFVLTIDHPEYHPPLPNEQHCYRKGRLIFPNLKKARWTNLYVFAHVDPDGSVDFGSPHGVETLPLSYGKKCLFHCDVGTAEIESDPPYIELDPRDDRVVDLLKP